MLRILAATTLVMLALCDECLAQSAKLEVIFAVLDADTVNAIAESPYLRDFSGLKQQTMQGSDEGHYQGIYIQGRENYLELFGPADLNLDGPAAAVGCGGVELNVERIGGLEQLKPLVDKSGQPVDIRTFHRNFNGRTVDWFRELGTPAELADSSKCTTPTTSAAIAEYVPSYLDEPGANKPPSRGPEDVVSRARYHHNDYAARLVQNITAARLAISRQDWPQIKAILAAAGYHITETPTGAKVVGDVALTLEFVSSRESGLREVDFALNSAPGTRRVELLGRSQLVVGPGPDAAWSFEPKQTNRWETLPAPLRLPSAMTEGRVSHEGADIWFAAVGDGAPVIMLHGGLTNSESWGNEIPALIGSHHRVILVDSRGHGRSSLGEVPLSYQLMESDVVAVMDRLQLKKASVVGWSDGAIISLIMAMKHPERVTAVYAFGANMDSGAVKPGAFNSPILGELADRLQSEYARVSPTPSGFAKLHSAVETMQKTQPNYSAAELAAIKGPRIAIVDGDHEEFITRDHTEYLAGTIPGAKLVILSGVSHFAPWQAPDEFNTSMLKFLDR